MGFELSILLVSPTVLNFLELRYSWAFSPGHATMTTSASISIPQPAEEEFQTERVLTITGGHFIHDTYTAFVAPLLPLIIEKLSLSLSMVGSLMAFMQLPAILNPFIGYLAELNKY